MSDTEGSFSNMSSIRGSLAAALDALDAAVDALDPADLDELDPGERYEVLQRLETAHRRQRAVGSAMIGRLEHVEGWPPVPVALADVLRVSRAEARRRVRDADQLRPRTTLTGQPLPPELPASAEAWRHGVLDPEHLRVIQRFLRELPGDLPADVVATSEAFLAEKAAELRPDQLAVLAERLALAVNPDGTFTDDDRARRRGFTWDGRQRPDGMSIGRLVATPELRAMLDAWFAKYGAPGMCNPADESPTVTGTPTPETAGRDVRGYAQRQHDALSALVRGQLGDPRLGLHNGLPVTVIVTATLDQLHTGAGRAVTAGGSWLPMRDVIRLASHAYHYLCVYDKHSRRPLYLGRSRRIASADQRVVMYGLHRGCTAPGCDKPGFHTEVHHCTDWARGGHTNADELTLACHADHDLLTDYGWTARNRADGITEWIPPPGLPVQPRINDFHHPERLLPEPDDDAA